MLRPVETPTREIKKLDGLWAFSLDRENCGIDQRWWESALQESRAIAVPGSFNDQFADADIRNYVGNGELIVKTAWPEVDSLFHRFSDFQDRRFLDSGRFYLHIRGFLIPQLPGSGFRRFFTCS